MTKTCSKCKLEKFTTEFSKKTSNKDGLTCWCKQCNYVYYREYKKLHKDELTNYLKTYQLTNKEKITEDKKVYYITNKEKIITYRKNHQVATKEARRLYMKNNKAKIKEARSLYMKNNKTRINAKANNYRATHPSVKIASCLRTRIRHALRGKAKASSTLTLLGCTIDQLKLHLQSKFKPGMAWNNYGSWHIDHIRPCASFDLLKETEQHACFHYTNLQPLWASENISKSDSYVSDTLCLNKEIE